MIECVCLSFLGQVPSFTHGCNLGIGSLDAFKAPANQGALEFLAGSLARGESMLLDHSLFGMLASRSWHDMSRCSKVPGIIHSIA